MNRLLFRTLPELLQALKADKISSAELKVSQYNAFQRASCVGDARAEYMRSSGVKKL
jgi:hypothetical protein